MLTHRLSISLSVTILLILFCMKKTHAARLEDAFGETYYGFKCSNVIYKKDDIFAAAKRLCDAFRVRPDVKNERSFNENGYRQPWHILSYQGILHSDNPYYMQPILKDGSLYPTELPLKKRVTVNTLGKLAIIDPGPDRIIINQNCEIITAFSDYDYMINDDDGKVEKCILLRSHEDVSSQILGK